MKMRSDRNMARRELIHSSLARNTRRVILGVAALMLATVFVIVACSAPQNQSAQSNNQQAAQCSQVTFTK